MVLGRAAALSSAQSALLVSCVSRAFLAPRSESVVVDLIVVDTVVVIVVDFVVDLVILLLLW